MHSSLVSAIESLDQLARNTNYQLLLDKWQQFLQGKKTWLQFKTGLIANARYIEQHTPQVLQGKLRVLDVGPGPGHFMLLCKALGNLAFGEDRALPLNVSESQPHAYRALTTHFGLAINYHGFHQYATEPIAATNVNLINFRGSIDGVISALCGESSSILKLFSAMHNIMSVNGIVFISHNIGAERVQFQEAAQQGIPGFDMLLNTQYFAKLKKL